MQTEIMLIPITRKKFEVLIPFLATGTQYLYCWGKVADLLRRLLISVVGIVVALFFSNVLGPDFKFLPLSLGIVSLSYWLWAPILGASLRNASYRKYPYAGFWRGEILDVYITEELIGTEETVNKRGELVIVENRERRLNLEIGDPAGFSTRLQVPVRRGHQAIAPGQVAETLLLSNDPDLGRIAKTADIYLPDYKLWVSDYPYLRRDTFVEVSGQLRSRPPQKQTRRGRSAKSPRRSAVESEG
ncbi:phosphate ABC transporter permease [Neosynechococcus sphagnicola]|uniref:phosphate ABC transporter permease n=1 Tax=Neosynechococcus sphagnicola TaxID=1501145 RepID=UPI001872FAC5|nr:phosphate ABC transporter permease [Neosynechococcus sphagnicola]